MKHGTRKIETEVIHSGYNADHHLGSLSMPIFQTSTFTFRNAEQGEMRFKGEEEGYVYSRLGNPTVRSLEEKMAIMEAGEAALAFSSGMAAVSATLISLTKANDHIICSQGIYGCTFGLLQLMEEKYNITHDFCAMETEEQLRALIRPETVCIYVETPINPTMKLVDLSLVVKVANEYGLQVVVDNTFSSPYLQQPLVLGCDIVLHSATKYICGHGDVIAGVVVGKKDFIENMAVTTQKDIGGVLAPFDAWLLLRGLKTLPVRMDRHCENAERLFQKLNMHPSVERVYYPGNVQHPDYPIMAKQMKKGGGLISFEIKGSKKDAQRVLNALDLIKIAVSLGDAETLIQHPATMTHSVIPAQERVEMGITDQLIRLSVGLEAWEDIWDDLSQALDTIL
ncbi:methionine gamma-lyase [Priestia koreensis]|uniref:L-methionine gamma-lyase n=1 Tax=Priestia koreensis TaxID=284581 RepID=A0A0M0KQM0_9BACI|nr:methionine gamma-lyase [Priestia koreensis]KOO41110.1 methionine gamma-lyase [Priestia koreensis]